MKERGFMFSAPMVRAILDGRKTQTRRLATSPMAKLEPGDRIWVRETFATPFRRTEHSSGAIMRADGAEYTTGSELGSHRWGAEAKWTPAIHMPRWASRLNLIVTDVRFQKLNDLTDQDAIAEGLVPWMPEGDKQIRGWFVPHVPHPLPTWRKLLGEPSLIRTTPREMYAALWDTLHGSGEWLGNPDVVAVTFKVEK